MKVNYEPETQIVPNEYCVFCEKKLNSFRKNYILLGWASWTEEYLKVNAVGQETIYTSIKKSPVQSHIQCAKDARMAKKAD